MKCNCGKEGRVCIRGENLCWACFTMFAPKSAGLHIDIPATPANPRVQLCNGAPGDGIYHMTPGIAAAYMAQHPDQQSEFCAGCLAVMYRDYLPTIAEARLYAAALK